MANLNNLSLTDIIGDEDFEGIEVTSNSKATPQQIEQVVTDFTQLARREAPNFVDRTHPAQIRNASLKKLTAWLLLQFAENGTSAVTQYPEANIQIRVHEQTAAAVPAQQQQQAVAAVWHGRDVTLSLQILVNTIRTRTTQRHWARFYANLTFRLAKTQGKLFAWGRNNGVPAHYGYLGFDTADFIDQNLLTISERKCIRRTSAFAIAESGEQEYTEDDGVITAVASTSSSKRASQQ